MDIRLAGTPAPQVHDALAASTISVYPQEFPGIKPRLKVKEGDSVKRGSPLFYDKLTEALQFRSPAAGTVSSIVYGPRRSIQEIRIGVSAQDETEPFEKYSSSRLGSLSRDEVLHHLQDTGLLAYVRERPFSRIANPAVTPKSIFVNAMNTAPFQPDFGVVVKGDEAAFQAGLDALSRLTEGPVHLCLPQDAPEAARAARNVHTHTFSGPHPSGNTSVHIHHVDAISPGQQVWAVKAVDVIAIGKLFLEGTVPGTKVISIGGTGVKENARGYYRVRIGSPLDDVLKGKLAEGEQRIISGDVLSGTRLEPGSGVRMLDASIAVLPEGRERHFLGWLAPGMNRYSSSRLFLSTWFKRGARWALNTNKNGSDRAMVVTGHYDRFLPMKIRVDYLVRAVLAHDTEEAVKLGLLETDPEDFALCAFACVSKMDLVGIMRKGLKEVEDEGL